MAESIGDGGAGRLKAVATDAVNDYFTPLRARRRELARLPEVALEILRRGNEHANELAEQTLGEVRQAMGMVY
ncbi:hypothetical protein FHU41_000727 [Psychromicrobium silvestre]|uniref:Tryptophan--tRNA ligase n=1 Tax=Psychromicrobium silvestre TaxID=1645614 RepID=A0A7Y9S6B1_9MICC|nr:hypothetical protein [Psychromicrobium silvestre]NYE94506.1 hypothetical protein [Psychromicrobium silvestre]